MPSQIFRELEKVRNLPGIRRLWELTGNFGFRARCWGKKPKEPQNPFGGSHILLFDGQDVVDIFQNPKDGRLKIIQFIVTKEDTNLGLEVKKILNKAGYEFDNL
ncbi:MAG: hypothetical protein PHY72_00315 [Candidatus Pacebacteria bacterium]|nr:hypothetical protein [Candidatus Paceibacterota bacterium]